MLFIAVAKSPRRAVELALILARAIIKTKQIQSQVSLVMSAPEFDIIFRGDIVFGHQLVEVKAKLQQLFKVDAARVDTLFTGRPVPLKRNLDEITANKYRDALLKAGAMIEVCSSDASPANAAPKPPPAPRRALGPASDDPAGATGWTLAPLGADLLPIKERPPQAAPVNVDISGLTLRAAEGNLIDADETREEIGAQIIAPDLGLAAVGSDLIGADEKLALPLVEIELANWEIADVGSDLGQLKRSLDPVSPDISGLRLADLGV